MTSIAANSIEKQPRTLRIGTRGSKLALAQTALVEAALLGANADLRISVETITTKGDAVQDQPLSKIGGNGVFVRGIELALQNGVIDLAVHSAKDLPSILAEGLTIAAYLPRADARDALISRSGETLAQLPTGARVGTSSPRRACQLRALRPDFELLDLRGNVDTRLRKLDEGQYNAIVLAAAGLVRLGLQSRIAEWLRPDVMLPAVGQGAIAVEVRAEDAAALELAGTINDPNTYIALAAERAFLRAMGGSCTLPVAAHAVVSGDRIRLAGLIGSISGEAVRGECEAAVEEAAQAGEALAMELLNRGGRALVEGSEAQGL